MLANAAVCAYLGLVRKLQALRVSRLTKSVTTVNLTTRVAMTGLLVD